VPTGKLIVSGEVLPIELRAWETAITRTAHRMQSRTWRATRRGMGVIEKRVKIYLRTYTHPEGTPTPSPPGGPPALVTGNLMRSWRSKGPRLGRAPYGLIGGGKVEMEGGPTAVYSRIQELGGRTGAGHRTVLPKRPYVRPMVLVVRREIRRIYVENWTQGLRQR
jgi:hypothetical protein